MLSFLRTLTTNKSKRNSRKPRRPERRVSLRLEGLEERALMSASPILFQSIQEKPLDFGNTVAYAKAVNLGPVMETQVSGSLTNSSDVDMFRVSLKKGEVFTAVADTVVGLNGVKPSVQPKLMLVNGQNQVQPASGGAVNELIYRVTTPGNYYVKLFRGDATQRATSGTSVGYDLHLRPMRLDDGSLDASYLRKNVSGAMAEYAWLNGGVLSISGPTGHGFGLRGNWSQTTSQNGKMTGSTYTATGDVYLVSAAGDVKMSSQGTGFVVRTQSPVMGQVYGEVTAIDFTATLSTAGLLTAFDVTAPAGYNSNMKFNFDLSKFKQEVTISAHTGDVAGIGLGSDARLIATGAPLNAAVPYLYFTINPLNTGATNVLSLVCDPADPALYIEAGVAGIPIGPLELDGVGFSQHGLIPFTAVAQPTQYQGQMSGHMVLQGSLDTTGLTQVPSKIDGDLTLNFDPNHTGKFLGGNGMTGAELAAIFAEAGPGAGAGLIAAMAMPGSPLQHNVNAVFHNFSVGVNGTLKINPFDKIQDQVAGILPFLSTGHRLVDKVVDFLGDKATDHGTLTVLSVANGSLVYDGPTLSTYFHGGTVNPFKDTILEKFYTPNSVDIDAAIKSGGKFYLDVKGTYDYLGIIEGGEIMIAKNYPVTGRAAQVLTAPILPTSALGGSRASASTATSVTGIYVDANIKIFGGKVDMWGRMMSNGDFEINGSAVEHLGPLDGSATFKLSNTQAKGFKFTSHLVGKATVSPLRGTATADFNFSVSGGQIHYAGSGTASVDVYAPDHGWNVTHWTWQHVGTVGVGISNSELWFSYGGHKVSVPLPH